MTITALMQAGGATVAALLAYALGFRVLLTGFLRAYGHLLHAQEEQLKSARDELSRMHGVHLELEGDIGRLKMSLARYRLANADLEARVARLQRELAVRTGELAAERNLSSDRLRMMLSLARLNAELEQGDVPAQTRTENITESSLARSGSARSAGHRDARQQRAPREREGKREKRARERVVSEGAAGVPE